MKVAILLEDLVEDVEFIYPYYRFKEEKFDVDIISPEIKTFKGKKGCTFASKKSIKDVDPEYYDILFIPGGYAPDRLRRYPEVLNFVRRMFELGKIIGAVCHGPWVLISAGIVKGKKITGYHAIKDDIINAGANYTGKPVERDGNIFTGTDPEAMAELIKEIIKEAKKNSPRPF